MKRKFHQNFPEDSQFPFRYSKGSEVYFSYRANSAFLSRQTVDWAVFFLSPVLDTPAFSWPVFSIGGPTLTISPDWAHLLAFRKAEDASSVITSQQPLCKRWTDFTHSAWLIFALQKSEQSLNQSWPLSYLYPSLPPSPCSLQCRDGKDDPLSCCKVQILTSILTFIKWV